MIFPLRPTRPLTIACPNFEACEVNALRSLLGLLKPHLHQTWQISEADEVDLMIINLDAPHVLAAAQVRATTWAGCALRPREHADGTLHRPLRVAQVLALLHAVEQGAPAEPECTALERSYRLRSWPAEFDQWPPAWSRVLASITRSPRSLGDICARVDLSMAEVERCIAALQALDLLDIHMQQATGMQAAVSNGRRWRSLAAKVGSLLGWSR